MSDLVKLPLGKVGALDVSIAAGVLVVEVDATLPEGSAGLVVKLDAGILLDLIAKAIPGTIDDAVISVLKTALKALG